MTTAPDWRSVTPTPLDLPNVPTPTLTAEDILEDLLATIDVAVEDLRIEIHNCNDDQRWRAAQELHGIREALRQEALRVKGQLKVIRNA